MNADTARHHVHRSLMATVVALHALVLAACGGGGGGSYGATNPTPPVATVARVEILQTGLVLTIAGATKQLSATAFDAQGNAITVPIAWNSTTPSDVVVDSTGKVTANIANGSSQIVAEASGVKSAPLLAVVTTLPTGAILLTDAQIVGDPVETDPNALPSFANTYKVVLTGVSAPAIGTLLINTESKPVLGRVVAVDTTGGQTTVTLGLVSLREAFPNLNINQAFDLRKAPVSISPGIAAAYDVKRTGDLFEFTPKPGVSGVRGLQGRTKALTPVGTRALPPFTACETTIPGFTEGSPLPISLSTPPIFSVAISPTLDLVYTSARGLERFVVKATPTFSVQGGVNVTAAFEGKIECTVELFIFRVPVGGPLSFVVSGLVPVGVGLEAGGKITVATMGLGTEVVVTAKAEAGIGCPGGANCEFVRSLSDFSLAMTPKLDAPSLGDLRVEPSLSAFGYLEADIGNPFFRSLRFNAFKVKAGGSLQGSFAPKVAQILDATYKSDYKVSLEAKAGVGTKLGSALSLLGLSSITALELGVSTNLATSPTGTVTADRATFVTGDTVHFRVQLDPATLDFFPVVGPYNVKKVVLVRNSGGAQIEVGSQDAIPRDAGFDFAFTAPNSGRADEFTAFIVTWLVPLDVFSLEVGAATPSTNLTVTLSVPSTLSGPTSITVTAQDARTGAPMAGATVTFAVDGGSISSGGVTNAGGQLSSLLTPAFGVSKVTVRADVVAASGQRGNATAVAFVGLPTSWTGTIQVSLVETVTKQLMTPPNGASFLGSTETASRNIGVSVAVPVSVVGLQLGQRAPFAISSVGGSGSILTDSLIVSEEFEDFGTFRECRVITRAGESVDAPAMTELIARDLGMTISADGSYVLDLGGFSGGIVARGAASVRVFRIRSLSPLETKDCGGTTTGNTDQTSTAIRGLTVGGAEVPDINRAISFGEISGTASKVTDLSSPVVGQTGSRTVTVTWTLRPVP